MNIEHHLCLRPITEENRPALLALSVHPAQQGYIESVAECLAEAGALSLWQPFGIFDGHIPIGFCMVGKLPSKTVPEGNVWFDRLLIDAKHQGKGYGSAAIKLILEYLTAQYPSSRILLSVYEENQAAIRLYQSFGFVFNGEYDTKGEAVMVLTQNNRRTINNED